MYFFVVYYLCSFGEVCDSQSVVNSTSPERSRRTRTGATPVATVRHRRTLSTERSRSVEGYSRDERKNMFTGIITHLGKLKAKDNTLFTFAADSSFHKRVYKGLSVAVNGVCLTALKRDKTTFSVRLMPETMRKTMLNNLKMHDLVNLELPATPNSFLSGHIVQGHIDGISKLVNIKEKGNSYTLKFSISNALSKYIVEKGSIAISGISLTVTQAQKNYFTVDIIPFTWKETMLRTLKTGDFVNIEVDILAKYLESLLERKK